MILGEVYFSFEDRDAQEHCFAGEVLAVLVFFMRPSSFIVGLLSRCLAAAGIPPAECGCPASDADARCRSPHPVIHPLFKRSNRGVVLEVDVLVFEAAPQPFNEHVVHPAPPEHHWHLFNFEGSTTEHYTPALDVACSLEWDRSSM